MAQLDPSIILQAGRGVTPLMSPAEIEDQQAQRAMRRLQMQQATQAMSDDQAYRQALQTGATGDALVANLQKAGLGKQAMEQQKFQLEQQKAQGERGKIVAEGMKQGAAMIMANPTEQNAIGTIETAAKQYGLPQPMVDDAKAKVYAARNDPNMLRQLAVGWGADAEKVLGKFDTVDLGQTKQTQRVNPITGEVTVGSVQQKSATPDALLQAQTSTANNQNTVNATLRGQNLKSDQFQQTQNQKAQTKPLPPAALKMQQESLDAIGTASSINADLGGLANQIDSGKLKFGPVSNLANNALNATGMSTEESRNFATFKSTLEKLRNDSLRLNKGVQTEGDAQRAWNELFQNINDTKLVRQRLDEVKALNDRAVQLRKLDVDTIRSNFNQDPMDYSNFTKQKAAVGQAEGPKAKTKSMNIGGRDVMAELAPDGNYYVQQNGKWFRVKE